MANNPSLSLPASEHVTSDGTVAVTPASYSDSFAASNPGAMYLGITDSSGGLQGYYPAPGGGTGTEAAGNNSNTLTFQGSYADVNAILNSLTYVAGAAGGSDDIHYDLWNQAGMETTGDVAVSISGAASADTWTGTVSSDWNNAANWSTGAVPVSGQSVLIPAQTPNDATLSNATLSGETINLADTASGAAPEVNFSDVTLGSGTVLETSATGDFLAPSIFLGGTLTIGAGATLETAGETGISVFNAGTVTGTVVNDGTLINTATPKTPYAVIDDLGGSFVNNGVVISDTANGGGWSFGPAVNNGSIVVTQGEIALDGTIAGGAITFNGPGAVVMQAMALTDGAVIAGFGQGDRLLGTVADAETGNGLIFANGTLDETYNGSVMNVIPISGSLGLGNFQLNTAFASASPSSRPSLTVAYAPNGGASDVGTFMPDISAPASARVAQGGTLGLGGVSIGNAATLTLDITATSGALFMNGASGSGTNHLSIASDTSGSQVNADLASLTYVTAAGASADTIEITADEPTNAANGFGPSVTSRYIPVTVSGTNGGPVFNEPSSETVAPGGSVAISGSYSDSYAQTNPGQMYVEAIASGGTVSAIDASGNAAPGSGTGSIKWYTDYNDVNAVLQSLTYTAGTTADSGSVYFEVWNQAGLESHDTVPVTITSGGGGSGGGAPVLTEPSSDTVTAGGTVSVSGSYSDSFARGNPGSLYLGISDSSGTLSATNALGQTVAGSGTSQISLSTDYVDVNAILASLHYTAAGSAGSDTISFDVWNQAGTETTGTTAETITSAQGSGMAMADFAAPTLSATAITPSDTGNAGSANLPVPDTSNPPIGMPLTLPS